MSRETHHVKVLLVDDEKELVETLAERLRTRGMVCLTAYNGEDALIQAQAEPPRVMVLDLKMPGMDGLEVLRRVRTLGLGIEVVMLTGHGSDKEERLARELGVFDYLTKPQPFQHLMKTILAAVGRSEEMPSSQPPTADGEAPPEEE